MTRRSPSGEYEFKLRYPSAQEVLLVGDFEPAREAQVPMARSPEGEWTCRLNLRDGIYHFKYWVDGNWCLDEDPQANPAASFLSSALVVNNQANSSACYVG